MAKVDHFRTDEAGLDEIGALVELIPSLTQIEHSDRAEFKRPTTKNNIDEYRFGASSDTADTVWKTNTYSKDHTVAERVVYQLIDDIDGSEIADGGGERIEFSLRGSTYQIDLSSANIAKLDKAMKPYIEAAMKVRGGRPARSKTSKANGSAPKEQLSAIREWARKNGHQVSDRGRIKSEVVEEFNAAH